ncbi:hypothetical protein GEV33_005205 [Tenebrio molitor]|uniref:Uncharacterized protein n=1 Tax=Tenebrio molitor TaxID=7067 RepID=A0A8J6HPA8_TENMO|nr:hypothetical protein GEV33_005205 [Tenebrio molitor]
MYLNVNLCERDSGSDREGGYSKISESFRAFYYREVPALALSPNHLPLRKKPDIVFFDKPRGPCAGIIDQPPLIPAAVNKGSSPSSLLDARWPRVDSIVPWRFAPLELRPPWRVVPLAPRPLALRPGDEDVPPLGCNLCTPHICKCNAKVDEIGTHGLSCFKSSGRFSRHTEINSIINRSLTSIHVNSTLEPNGLSRDDGKRPDGMTLVPWIKDSYVLKSSEVSGFAAEMACKRKHSKYSSIISSNYVFKGLAFETLGPWCKEAIDFINVIGNRLIAESGDSKSKKFLFERISLAIQRGNAASIRGTFPDSAILSEIFLSRRSRQYPPYSVAVVRGEHKMNPPHPLMGIWIVDKTINTWKEFLMIMSMTLMATFFFTIPGLTERFHEHSRGRNGPVAWPARSPDLIPCDFFLWGYMKELVYSAPVDTIEILQERVDKAAEVIRNNGVISDGKRADGMSLVPWKGGKAFLWDVTCRDTLAATYIPLTSKKAGDAARLGEDAKRMKGSKLFKNCQFYAIIEISADLCDPNMPERKVRGDGRAFPSKFSLRIQNLCGHFMPLGSKS